ncbi:hypothetical protein LSUB1_G006487 [Lachnellula subtilissima]|uniref:Uncharacterized protein n=1 Tax=Lachnellula subtilissima TaxID=602034 RepID=A0A8H8U5F7_9HELO|nr:hypothetical protein LSUB1_G006487 [Lachnellula subtilissima]
MPCVMARIGNKCLHGLGIKAKERRPSLVISGPSVNFPGYSEDDISLMREKAIASTAITEDDVSDDDFVSRHPSQPRSRAGSTSFGLGAKMVWHARRFSRSGRGVMW